MKRLFLLLTGLMVLTFCPAQKKNKTAAVISRETGSITFVVDEDLPAPTGFQSRQIIEGKSIGQSLLSDRHSTPAQVLATSFGAEEQFYSLGKDVFYRTLVEAFAGHRPLVLSPDMIWMMISQGFAGYVNAHPEELRHLLVDHEGKIDLVVEKNNNDPLDAASWEAVVDSFCMIIMENTKGDLAETLTKDYSTTGRVEHIASRVVLMKAVESYFNYVVIGIACGIPHITLEGTPGDWQQVLSRTKTLEPFGLKVWVDRLTPVLEQFVKAAEGEPDRAFWQDIVRQKRVDELRGGACNPEQPTELDGWFLVFFPDKDGNIRKSVKHTERMPSELVHVGFKFIQVDPASGETFTTPMELTAGFIGADVDEKTKAMRPRLGWMVSLAETDEEQLERLQRDATDFGINLRISKVPEVLSRIPEIRRLTLTFTGDVELPAWMDTMHIQQIIVRGRMSEAQKTELRRRFPKIRLQDEK